MLRVPGPKRQPSAGFFLCKALICDNRFLSLEASHRYVLLVAAIRWADASGEFYPTKRTWADNAGVGESVVDRAVREAERLGLLHRSPVTRPSGRSGSNVYAFASSVMAEARTQPSKVAELAGEGVSS
jgi:hypothetical protein